MTIHCSVPNLNNPCDPTSKSWTERLLVKGSINDKSPDCGINYFSNSGDSGDSGTSTLSLSVTINGLSSGSTLDLSLNGIETKSMTTSGTIKYSTSLANGSNFSIIGAQRATFALQSTKKNWITQTCTPALATGIINGANSTQSLTVSCSENQFVKDANTGHTWMRCSQGQNWTGINCSGGVAGTFLYCSAANNSCNDLLPLSEVGAIGHLDGTGVSAAWTSCNGLNPGAGTYGITSWRVPRKSELKGLVYCSSGTPTPLADLAASGAAVTPNIDQGLFPNTVINAQYHSSTATSLSNEWYVDTADGGTYNTVAKNVTPFYLRCISN